VGQDGVNPTANKWNVDHVSNHPCALGDASTDDVGSSCNSLHDIPPHSCTVYCVQDKKPRGRENRYQKSVQKAVASRGIVQNVLSGMRCMVSTHKHTNCMGVTCWVVQDAI
jgi:hypothetical protein